MITLAQLTEILGWASIINIGVLVFASIALVSMKSIILPIHSKMFDIPESELPKLYFNYLGNFKALAFIFILSPYFALKICGY